MTNTPPISDRFWQLCLQRLPIGVFQASGSAPLAYVIRGLQHACEAQRKPWLVMDLTQTGHNKQTAGATLTLGQTYGLSLAQLGLTEWMGLLAHSLPEGLQALAWTELTARLGTMQRAHQDWRNWEHWLPPSFKATGQHAAGQEEALHRIEDGIGVLLQPVIIQMAQSLGWEKQPDGQHSGIQRKLVPLSMTQLYGGRCTLKLGHLPPVLQVAVFNVLKNGLCTLDSEALTVLLETSTLSPPAQATLALMQALQQAGHRVFNIVAGAGLSDTWKFLPLLSVSEPTPEAHCTIVMPKTVANILRGKASFPSYWPNSSGDLTGVSFPLAADAPSRSTVKEQPKENRPHPSAKPALKKESPPEEDPALSQSLDDLFGVGLFQNDPLFGGFNSPLRLTKRSAHKASALLEQPQPVAKTPTGEDKTSGSSTLPAEVKTENPEAPSPLPTPSSSEPKEAPSPVFAEASSQAADPPRASSSKTASKAFKEGDPVVHPNFGAGVVQRVVQTEQGSPVVKVQFENVGKRLLDPVLSGLEHAP